jgi:hypothetical protein
MMVSMIPIGQECGVYQEVGEGDNLIQMCTSCKPSLAVGLQGPAVQLLFFTATSVGCGGSSRRGAASDVDSPNFVTGPNAAVVVLGLANLHQRHLLLFFETPLVTDFIIAARCV